MRGRWRSFNVAAGTVQGNKRERERIIFESVVGFSFVFVAFRPYGKDSREGKSEIVLGGVLPLLRFFWFALAVLADTRF